MTYRFLPSYIQFQRQLEEDDIGLGYEMSITEPSLAHYFVTDHIPSKVHWARAYLIRDEDEQTFENALAGISLQNHALVVCVIYTWKVQLPF